MHPMRVIAAVAMAWPLARPLAAQAPAQSGASYRLEVAGTETGTFREIVVPQRAGTAETPVGRGPVRVPVGKKRPPGPITLRGCRGGCGAALEKWEKALVQGRTERRPVTIIATDKSGKEVARYTLTNAWPVKVSTGAPRPGGTLETTVELEYESMQESR